MTVNEISGLQMIMANISSPVAFLYLKPLVCLKVRLDSVSCGPFVDSSWRMYELSDSIGIGLLCVNARSNVFEESISVRYIAQ